MANTEQQWYVDLVRDRYHYLNLTYEQAEKVYKYEQDKALYSEKHFFSAWEEWDFELTIFQDVLNEEQFVAYKTFFDETIQRYEQSLVEQDKQDSNQIAYHNDLINFYEQKFIPDFFKGPFLGFIWLRTDKAKVDFLKAEYKHFLNDLKKEILTSHFRHNRRFRPNQLKVSLLRHKVSCVFPDYNLFRHSMDEPTKAVAEFLKRKIIQLPDETEKLVTRKFQELREFSEASFTKRYGDIRGWHVGFGQFTSEEEKENRVMSLILLDKGKYCC